MEPNTSLVVAEPAARPGGLVAAMSLDDVYRFAERLAKTRGLIVLFGQASEEWVRARLDEGRKLMVSNPGGGLRFCGVLLAPPSVAKPESFEPPYGIWSARNAEMSLTITPPTSMSRCAWNARFRLLVNTPACRPKRESFTTATASSNVW